MQIFLLILFSRFFSKTSRLIGMGNGSTWPGHIALKINKNFIQLMLRDKKVILVAGTNGKTTTTKMLQTIFEMNGKKIIKNPSGANLLNGIASGILAHAKSNGNLDEDIALFEVDENALPIILDKLTPTHLILLNLFRDQLDRYGEVNTIAKKWKRSVERLTDKTTLIINADDPQMVFISNNTRAKIRYFGLEDHIASPSENENTSDSAYCPQCGHKLSYKNRYYSHIGEWFCKNCALKRPQIHLAKTSYYPLAGMYNTYNTLAAVAVAIDVGFTQKNIDHALETFHPAFGRQERISVDKKFVQIFLSKNPTGFNESIKTIRDLNAKTILLIVNDNIADGQDISWIWDIKTELLLSFAKTIIASGKRAYDLGLRVKYTFETSEKSDMRYFVTPSIQKAIDKGLKTLSSGETLYILPTYTAMLAARKAITGKEIL